MSAENNISSEWLNESEAQFNNVNELAAEVGAYNSLHESLIEGGNITIESFKEITKDYLKDEQEKTFGQLIESSKAAPYEELARKDLEIEAVLGEIASKVTIIEDPETPVADKLAIIRDLNIPEAEKIQREQNYVAELIPDLMPKISKEASRLLEKMLVDKAKEPLEEEKAELEEEKAVIASVYEVAGQAWPVPRLINTENIGPEVVYLDEFPERRPRLTKADVVERVKGKYPEDVLKGASEFVALLLAEEPGTIFSPEELAGIAYGNNSRDYRARIMALVNGFEIGRVLIIGKILEEQKPKLVLQKGERTCYRKETGERFGRRNVVYRAVPIAEGDRKEHIYHYDEDGTKLKNAGWHTIIFDADAPLVSHDLSTEELKDLQSRNVAEFDQETIEDQELYDIDLDEENIEPEVSNPSSPEQSETITPETESSGETKSEQKKEPGWAATLRSNIQDTLTRFIEDGLMADDTISWHVIKAKSSSGTMGTSTMIERGIKHRIITRTEGQLDSRLPISKFVCLAIQNNQPHLFENRSQRRRAMDIIEAAVNKYFEQAKVNN